MFRIRFFAALVLIQQVLYKKERELIIDAMKEKWKNCIFKLVKPYLDTPVAFVR